MPCRCGGGLPRHARLRGVSLCSVALHVLHAAASLACQKIVERCSCAVLRAGQACRVCSAAPPSTPPLLPPGWWQVGRSTDLLALPASGSRAPSGRPVLLLQELCCELGLPHEGAVQEDLARQVACSYFGQASGERGCGVRCMRCGGGRGWGGVRGWVTSEGGQGLKRKLGGLAA